MKGAVPALGIDGGFDDFSGLALVLMRQLGNCGFQVFDFVDAREVEDVVDLVGCEGWRDHVCGRYDFCCDSFLAYDVCTVGIVLCPNNVRMYSPDIFGLAQ